DLGSCEIDKNTYRLADLVGRGADVGQLFLTLFLCAVRRVDPEDACAGVNQLDELLDAAARWSDRGDDFGAGAIRGGRVGHKQVSRSKFQVQNQTKACADILCLYAGRFNLTSPRTADVSPFHQRGCASR